MKKTQDISKILQQMRVLASSKLDERVHREIDNPVTSAATAPDGPELTLGQIFALLLKRPSARYTLATTVVLAGLVALALIHPTPSAWAMEQSVEALKKYKGLQISGYANIDGNTYPADLWLKADATGDEVEAVLLKVADAGTNAAVLWTRDNQTYRYDTGGKTMYVEPGITFDANLFTVPKLLTLLPTIKDYQSFEGDDPATGRRRVVVTCSLATEDGPESFVMEFDVRTKLLVTFKLWHNSRQEGAPIFDFKKILYFEDLPASVFDFRPPAGTPVTNLPLTIPDAVASLPAMSDPNYGISAEGMTHEQAGQKILGQLWAARFTNDFARIRQLYPVSADWSDEFIRETCKVDGIVQLLKIGGIEKTGQSKLGPLALIPSWVREQDGIVKEVWMIIQFRETDRGTFCVVYGEHGYVLNAKE